MNSDHENKCTLISSTFEVEENKVPLFFGSDAIWGRYQPFVIIWLVRGFPVPLENNKINITRQDELWSWK